MAKTPTRPEVSVLHGILTRLEWVKKEYLELPRDLRDTLEESAEIDGKYLPKLASLIIATEEMVNTAEATKPEAEER